MSHFVTLHHYMVLCLTLTLWQNDEWKNFTTSTNCFLFFVYFIDEIFLSKYYHCYYCSLTVYYQFSHFYYAWIYFHLTIILKLCYYYCRMIMCFYQITIKEQTAIKKGAFTSHLLLPSQSDHKDYNCLCTICQHGF